MLTSSSLLDFPLCSLRIPGATADAFTLFERLEGKLEEHTGQLTRAAVELAKMWRMDKYLRRLDVRWKACPGLEEQPCALGC